ncbi:hypothetical protein [Motiliproteus sp. SC1-56]|uniref:hypothetical protein n=1 Tax=Motiliproteus sp. SC1-56 TaxID=2799565 RepID=UPI001A8E455B|nr:hypothetical protein [Motiliproteus sp. SC1-56]
MLTYEDCLDMCDLTQEEIDAVAEHEHMDRIQALATAEYLIHTDGGERSIRKMIIDDIRAARAHGDEAHEQTLKQVLVHFIQTHPRHHSASRQH